MSISKQLKQLDLSKMKLKNGRTVEQELRRHAKVLADCILYELNEVYESYEPKIYERTYGLWDSLRIDDFVYIMVSSKSSACFISLFFDDNAFHRSFDGKMVNTAILINEGWKWDSNAHISYLSERAGSHFIEKGIYRYKKMVRKPFEVRLKINNEEIRA